MQINIVSKGIKLDDELRSVIETGIGSIENRFKGEPTCRVSIKTAEKNLVKVSVLVYAGKHLFKGEDTNKDKVVAFNRALKDVERNLNKLKTKQIMRRYIPAEIQPMVESEDNGEEHLAEVEKFVCTEKEVEVSPMTVEEAYVQMELLGHTFFAFVNSQTGLINIIYRKRTTEESYGLIQLVRNYKTI